MECPTASVPIVDGWNDANMSAVLWLKFKAVLNFVKFECWKIFSVMYGFVMKFDYDKKNLSTLSEPNVKFKHCWNC
jgi:hypothetical protein